jgi:adenylylsulfate kinase
MTGHQGFTVWFTGLPCCGKTTLADRVAVALQQKGHLVERLDGDIVRQGLTSDLGFSKHDRDENIRRVTFVAQMLTRNGIVVLATFVSPYQEQRTNAREKIGKFVEVYVRCPVDLCMKRDVKGMYRKAREGKIKGFTGVDDPYEEPAHPELIVDTDKETVEESVSKVLSILTDLGYIMR